MDYLHPLHYLKAHIPKKIIKPTLITGAFQFILYLFTPFLSPYLSTLVEDPFLISIVFGIFPFVITFVTPITGHLSDVIGRKRLILFGIIIQLFSVFFYMIADSLLLFIIGRILNGIGYAATLITGITKVEDKLDNKSRGLYTGMLMSFLFTGSLLGPLAGAYFAETYSVKFMFLMAFNFLLALLIYCLIFFQTNTPKSKRTKISFHDFIPLQTIKKFLAHKKLRGMALMGMSVHGSMPAIRVFLPLYIVDSLGLSYKYVGLAFFILGIFHLFEFVWGWISDRVGYPFMIMTGTLGGGIVLFLMGQTASWDSLLILLLFNSLCMSIWNSSAMGFLGEIGEEMKSAGSIIGSYVSISKIGSILSFVVSGLVVKVWGISVLFAASGALIIVGCLAALPFFRN